MGRKQNLLDKAKNNPKGLSFDEFETLLSLYDWIFAHQTGSHRIWYSTKKTRLSIQDIAIDELETAWQGVKESYLKHGETIPVASSFKEIAIAL